MFFLLLTSIIGAALLHHKFMKAYVKEYFHGDTKIRYPWQRTLILGGVVALPAIASYFFIRKYPMLGMILIAILVAVLAIWICAQTKTKKIQALVVYSLVLAALAAIAKAQLADNIGSVSILSILGNGLIPIGVSVLVGFVRWLYLAGFLSERLDKDRIKAELDKLGKKKPSKATEIRQQQLNAQLARFNKKEAHGEFMKQAKNRFKYGFAEEPEEPEEEAEEDEYEDIYSDSSLEPSNKKESSDKKFYYIVFGVVIIVVVVCLSIVLMNL